MLPALIQALHFTQSVLSCQINLGNTEQPPAALTLMTVDPSPAERLW